MQKAIIFGLGNLTKIVLFNNAFLDDPFDIVAITVDPEFVSTDELEGIPVIPYDRIKQMYPPESGVGVIVTVGYANMNQNRERISKRIMHDGYELLNFIDKQAIVRAKKIGVGNIILEGCSIAAGSTLGDGNIFYPNSAVSHHCVIGSYNLFACSSAVGGGAQMGDCCFTGLNAIVRDECNVASYTLIGSGAYVSADTSAYSVVVPAKSRVLEGRTSLQMKL